jgi:hypothetical protein
MTNTAIWDNVTHPPPSMLKQIAGGKLKGKSDINPQWRLRIMTEQFGPCGLGWRYEIERLWTEPGPNGEVMAFALVNLFIRQEAEWSAAIPGVGGSTMIAPERGALTANDECYKMAVTDALSVAMKAIGVAADIYMGLWDGSKYRNGSPTNADIERDRQALKDSIAQQVRDIKKQYLAKYPELANLDKATLTSYFYDWAEMKPGAEIGATDIQRMRNLLREAKP